MHKPKSAPSEEKQKWLHTNGSIDITKIIYLVTQQINNQLAITNLGNEDSLVPRVATIYYLKCPVSYKKLWDMQKTRKSDLNMGRNKQGQKLPVRATRFRFHREIFQSSHCNYVQRSKGNHV